MNIRTLTAIKGLTFVMFAMFAMTTDSVGIIIPEIIKTFRLSLTAAGSFQYATMSGIALAGFFLGHLADRLGRKSTIVAGLTLFALTSYLFIAGNSFPYFCALMALSGIAIGVFKTGALALIGDIAKSTAEHTSLMNTVEGFFGVGSITGPAILAQLLGRGISWQWLYVIAGSMCVLLIVTALGVRYPSRTAASEEHTNTKVLMAVYEEPFCSGIFVGGVSLCRGRVGNLCLDADFARRVSRAGNSGRRVQHLDFLSASRCRAFSRSLDAEVSFAGPPFSRFQAA